MATITDELDTIALRRARVAEFFRAAEVANAELLALTEQVRERIRKGESTGDPLVDFVVAYHGPVAAIEGAYRDIERRIAGYPGECVLVVERREDYPGCTGFGHEPESREYVIETTLYFGVLSGDKLTFELGEKNRAVFPTKSHLRVHSPPGPIARVEEPLSATWPPIATDLNRPLELKHVERLEDEDTLLAVELCIGNTEVRAWFDRHYPGTTTFKDLAEKAGALVLTSPETEVRPGVP